MRNVVFSNMRLKLLALAFSIALWFFVAGQSNTEIGFLVPLGIKGMPKDMAITSPLPGEVEVRVTGPKLFINNLSPSQIITELDLSGAKEGLNTYRFQPNDVITPIGVEVLRLRPSAVDIRMERLSKVSLPVRPRLTGSPAQGYRVSNVTVAPRAVSASGVKRDIKDLTGIPTKAIDISGLRENITITVPLEYAHELRYVSEDSVTVRLTIERER